MAYNPKRRWRRISKLNKASTDADNRYWSNYLRAEVKFSGELFPKNHWKYDSEHIVNYTERQDYSNGYTVPIFIFKEDV